jgi:hypothetical protein
MTPSSQSLQLEAVAQRIQEAVSLAAATAKTSCVRAAEVGRLLLLAKRLVGHGGFVPFVARIGMSRRSASNLATRPEGEGSLCS